jgi:hypothetical protein
LACFCDCRIWIIFDMFWIFNCFTRYSVFFGLSRAVMRGVMAFIITSVSLFSRQWQVLFVKFPFPFSRKEKTSQLLVRPAGVASLSMIGLVLVLSTQLIFYGILAIEWGLSYLTGCFVIVTVITPRLGGR